MADLAEYVPGELSGIFGISENERKVVEEEPVKTLQLSKEALAKRKKKIEKAESGEGLSGAELRLHKKNVKKAKKAKKKNLGDMMEDANSQRKLQSGKRDAEKDKRTLFVGNVPCTTKKKDLRKFFQKYGVESIRFRSFSTTKPSLNKRVVIAKQYFSEKIENMNAYVVVKSKELAEDARKLNGTEFKGCHLRVDLCSGGQRDDSKCVFVGNLKGDVDDEGLREFFLSCGEIDYVRCIRDTLTRVGKGIAYVCFKDGLSVVSALALDGKKFQTRKLRISRCDARHNKKKNFKERLQQEGIARRKQNKLVAGGVNKKNKEQFNKKRDGKGKKRRYRDRKEFKDEFVEKRAKRLKRKGLSDKPNSSNEEPKKKKRKLEKTKKEKVKDQNPTKKKNPAKKISKKKNPAKKISTKKNPEKKKKKISDKKKAWLKKKKQEKKEKAKAKKKKENKEKSKKNEEGKK